MLGNAVQILLYLGGVVGLLDLALLPLLEAHAPRIDDDEPF